jgi:hypothetical protein
MSILDDAIREHLELKRAHGADEAEIKRLEDEAFGPPGRPDEPDPAAEAPTEFMAQPDAPQAPEEADVAEEGGRRINIADLQEPPPEPRPQEEPRVEATEAVEPQAEATPIAPAEDPAQAAPPAEEEPPAIEHEIVPEAAEPAEAEAQADAAAIEPAAEETGAGHSTEERHAIAEQPTELFDIEAEMGTEDAPAAEAPGPSDEEPVEAEAAEPKLAPVEPVTEIHASRAAAPADAADEEEEDDDFWSEQRLSDELDQALEAPPAEEEPAAEADKGEAEQPQHDEYEPRQAGHEDVLEDTPEFLEESPEDDELWFEQRPPKDFDFDD